MNLDLLNKKIKKFKVNENNISKKDLISFYWSKKNPNVLFNIINEFGDENNVIFDPFLGSGPILFSLDATKKNFKFIGNEINEMPLSFINFNLKNISESELYNIKKKFNLFYQDFKKYYEYQSPVYKENIQLKKMIFNYKKDNKIQIK